MSQNDELDQLSRRDFIRKSAEIVGAAALTPGLVNAGEPAATVVRQHSDMVELGKTGVKISRMGMGTGSINGKIQRDLGQKEFTRLVHYCFDHGIRYIDTADQYEIHHMVKEAIRGLPREKLYIQTKMRWIEDETRLNPLKHIDRFRKEVGTDYFDSVLIHCTTKPTWPTECKVMMDGFDEAQRKGWLRLKGMSCHGLGALRAAATHDWIQVQLARVNPQGRHVDSDERDVHTPQGKPDLAFPEIRKMRATGRGIIGMKMIGNGDFKDARDRETALSFAMTSGMVDAIVVGFGSTSEVDEAIERVNRALKG